MSYEHCETHDMDATNGCPVCNGPNVISNAVSHTEFMHVEENVYDTAKQQIDELWTYVEEARQERKFHGGHSCKVAGDEWGKFRERAERAEAEIERLKKALKRARTK